MIILEVKPARKHRYLLVLDECEMLLDSETVEQHKLKAGVKLTHEQLEKLKLHSNCIRALSKGSWLLGQRDYSCKGLRDMLLPDFGEYASDYAIGQLESVGALNDERYANLMAEYYAEYKNLSRKAIVQELYKKGISRATAQTAAENLEYDHTDAIVRIISAKYRGYATDEKIKRRMIAALQRKGFTFREINTAIDQINEENGY